MASNRGGSEGRPLQQPLTQTRQRNPRVNNEAGIRSDTFSDPAATPPHRRITRSRYHTIRPEEFYAPPEPSSPLHVLPDSFVEPSQSLSSSTDSGLLVSTPEASDSPMHDPDFAIEADARYPQPQTEETSGHWKPPRVPFDDRFLIHDGRLNYHQLKQREMFENRYVSIGVPDTPAVLALITGTGLLNTITDVGAFPRELILEFYANFSGNPGDRVFVRGSMFEFSPQLINHVYKTADIEPHPVSECDRVLISEHNLALHLSEGRCIHWSTPFSPEIMPHYLAALFRISCYNWIPTKNVAEVSIECAKLLFMIDQGMMFNFGKLVFDQVARVARSPGHLREIIPFPNLIYNILAYQRSPTVRNDEHAELLLPREIFNVSLHRYGYSPPSDPQSSSPVHARTIGDDLRAQAQELDRQGNELHMRAMQLRTLAAKIDEGGNNTSCSRGRMGARSRE